MQTQPDLKADCERLNKTLDDRVEKLHRITAMRDFTDFVLKRRRGVPDPQLGDDIDAFIRTIK